MRWFLPIVFFGCLAGAVRHALKSVREQMAGYAQFKIDNLNVLSLRRKYYVGIRGRTQTLSDHHVVDIDCDYMWIETGRVNKIHAEKIKECIIINLPKLDGHLVIRELSVMAMGKSIWLQPGVILGPMRDTPYMPSVISATDLFKLKLLSTIFFCK